MTVDEFLERFRDYQMTFEQRAYAHYLEGLHHPRLRFLYEFGFENAEELAWEYIGQDYYEFGLA